MAEDNATDAPKRTGKRGRPPMPESEKKQKVVAESTGPKRGRGRPPKANKKAAAKPAGGAKGGGKRGRPAKAKEAAKESASEESAAEEEAE